MLIQLLWQFAPATGTVLQYHIVDHLHATDTQWGLWQGIFFGSFIPIYTAYGFLSRRFALRPLLWFGFTLAIFQMCPLLLVMHAVGAIIAAAPMGIIGGLAQASLVDLVIRSAPPWQPGHDDDAVPTPSTISLFASVICSAPGSMISTAGSSPPSSSPSSSTC
jgi:hypothetical protein